MQLILLKFDLQAFYLLLHIQRIYTNCLCKDNKDNTFEKHIEELSVYWADSSDR